MSEGPREPLPQDEPERAGDRSSKDATPSTSGQQQLPDNPFSTETVSYAVGDELLAVRLRGGPISTTQISTGVMGAFVFRLHELFQAIALQISGTTPGKRGPLAHIPDAGLLAVRQLEFGHSATFLFALGAPEQTTITPAGDVSSITASALETLERLIIVAAKGVEDELYEETRNLSNRAGDNLDRLVQVFAQNEVSSLWRFADDERAIDLSATRAVRTKNMLDYQELPRPQEQPVRGFLYQVNAREHTFLLDPAEGEEEKLTGRYPEHMAEDLRRAWNREVVALLRTTHYFLRRQVDPAGVQVELIEILEVFE